MTINSNVLTPAKLSLEEIIEAIKQLSSTEQSIIIKTLNSIGLDELKPIPYVIQLEPGKTIEQIFKERGYKGVNWARVDEIVKDLDIQEPIVPKLKPLPNVIQLEPGKSLEQILKERGYKGVNWARIDELAKEFKEIEEQEELEKQKELISL